MRTFANETDLEPMLKTLVQQIKGYKTAAILTPVWTALEVLMDVMIPYVTASLIDKGINAGDIQNVYFYGAIMLGMALMSLVFGMLGGRCSAYASTGFAANLRSAMYRNIQRLAFSDIDKYSTAGLVTRMTTDVNSLQSAFQQIMGVSVRAPFKLVLSILMCLMIDARLAIPYYIARSEAVPTGVCEVRRTEPERTGEYYGHQAGKGFRA